jgi:hypothetical protein
MGNTSFSSVILSGAVSSHQQLENFYFPTPESMGLQSILLRCARSGSLCITNIQKKRLRSGPRLGVLPQSPGACEDSQLQLPLEPETYTGLVSEIALIVVATRKAVTEACQEVINLNRPNGDRFGKRNVKATANDKIKGVIAG